MASLADAYKPNRRAGMEHSPRPMNPWPAVDRAAASLAQYIPSPAQGRRMSMDEEGNVYGSTAEENQLSSLVDFLAGTGAAPTAMARQTPGMLNAIGVWHGSPHKFDKFDLSKIGTGEGAQAYGHGAYLAESRDVGEGYRKALSAGRGADAADVAARILDTAGGDVAEAIKIVDSRRKIGNLPGAQEHWDAVAGVLKGDDPRGYLYKVSLEWPDPAREAADPLGPHHFLDWDAPLSGQSPEILEALEKAGLSRADMLRNGNFSIRATPSGKSFVVENPNGQFGRYKTREAAQARMDELIPSYSMDGKLAYTRLGGNPLYSRSGIGKDAEVSSRLYELGIPGIKYLDSGSRAAGDGTRNYVAFDASLAKILERNGIPIR